MVYFVLGLMYIGEKNTADNLFACWHEINISVWVISEDYTGYQLMRFVLDSLRWWGTENIKVLLIGNVGLAI